MNHIIIPPSLKRYFLISAVARAAICLLLGVGSVLILLFCKEIYAGFEGVNRILFYLTLVLAPILLSGIWKLFRYPSWSGTVTKIEIQKTFDEKRRPQKEQILTLAREDGTFFERKHRVPWSYFNGPELYEVGDLLCRVGRAKYIYCVPRHVNDPVRCVFCGQYYAPGETRCGYCRKELILPVQEPNLPAVRDYSGQKKPS